MPPTRRGRPPRLDEPDKQALLERFEKYVDENELPIVARFAANEGLWKSYFYEHPEFANVIKKCVNKKEAALEEGALLGTLNPTMAIFSLKQRGHDWRDKEAKIVFVDPKTLTDKELKELIDNGS